MLKIEFNCLIAAEAATYNNSSWNTDFYRMYIRVVERHWSL